MDKFLETYSPLKLNQEETDNLNRLLTRSETEYIEKKKKKKNLLAKKSPGPDCFTEEYYKTYKELIPTFLKLFQNII